MTQHFDYCPSSSEADNQSVGHQYWWLAGGYDLDDGYGGYDLEIGHF